MDLAKNSPDGDFDDADFGFEDPDSHPDEVVLPAPAVKSHHFNGVRNGPGTNGANPNQTRPAVNRQQPMRPPLNGVHQGAASNSNNPPPQPKTPNSGFTRSTSGAGSMLPPQAPQDSGQPARSNPAQPVVAGRVLNQPSRMGTGPPSAPTSPARINKSQEEDIKDLGMPPPGSGFFSARAASVLPEGPITEPLPPSAVQNLPAFNLRLESPSIRKTPGIDHKGSRPVGRDLKQLPGSSQAPTGGAAGARPNIVNPQMDAARKIGAPGSPSPMANRGQYKPPTMKRPVDGGGGQARVPLVDLPANGAIGTGIVDVGGDAKRQRLNN